jgi:DNA-binding winged helix-turn-helix (wHTH) protein/TolB-like protein
MYRFGVFHFDADCLELSRDGRPVRLQPQPAQVLLTLLANAGRTVSREELRQAVWQDDTYVDFDRGLNFCIAQIRGALGDDAGTPRYIRTIPKRGYEFVCPVEPRGHRGGEAEHKGHKDVRRFRRLAATVAAAVVIAAAALFAYRLWAVSRAMPIVAIVRFDNETGDASLSRFSDNLTDTVTVQLTQAADGRFGVIGNAAILRRPRQERDLRTIAATLNARFIVLGQIQRDQDHVRVLAHLIRMPEQTHVRVSRTDDLPQATLAEADAIAGKIANAFGATLRDPASRDSRVAATR